MSNDVKLAKIYGTIRSLRLRMAQPRGTARYDRYLSVNVHIFTWNIKNAPRAV